MIDERPTLLGVALHLAQESKEKVECFRGDFKVIEGVAIQRQGDADNVLWLSSG